MNLNERKKTTMITATLPVKGLNFAGCAREIEKNLGKLDSIARVEASYVSQTVTVTYDETAEVVLMRSDPLDVLAAIRLSKATVTKMKQNLFWAAIYNVIAIPVAAGVLYPIGILLVPEVGALAMSASSITVATNAVLLKSVEKKLRA